jgi:site-specific recombinase XerD
MAWAEYNRQTNTYRIGFRFSGRQYHLPKEYRYRDAQAADAKCEEIDETIRLIEQGRIAVPEGVDFRAFIGSGGRISQKPIFEPPAKPMTLGDLFDAYIREMSEQEHRDSTLRTIRIHANHLSDAALLGRDVPVDSLSHGDIEGYVKRRRKQRWRDEPIQRDTIEKELETLGTIWRWGARQGMVKSGIPWDSKRLVQLPPAQEKTAFMTYDQIYRRIQRGGLSDAEQEELWEGLYLTGGEVKEVLDLVEQRPAEPFVYPMFAFVALTGARKSELLRSQLDDFDFDLGYVTIRGVKGRKRTKTVLRNVHIHDRLREAMETWLSRHPGGQYVLCRADRSPLTKDAADYHFGLALEGTRWSVIRGFHVFRHSLISILASQGKDQRYIDEYVGHQTEAVRKRYRHLFPTTQQRPIDSLLE